MKIRRGPLFRVVWGSATTAQVIVAPLRLASRASLRRASSQLATATVAACSAVPFTAVIAGAQASGQCKGPSSTGGARGLLLGGRAGVATSTEPATVGGPAPQGARTGAVKAATASIGAPARCRLLVGCAGTAVQSGAVVGSATCARSAGATGVTGVTVPSGPVAARTARRTPSRATVATSRRRLRRLAAVKPVVTEVVAKAGVVANGPAIGPAQAGRRLLGVQTVRGAANVGPALGAWRAPTFGPVVGAVIGTGPSVVVGACGLLVARSRAPKVVVQRRSFAIRRRA